MVDLRIKAMAFALEARANAEQDVVELAERIYGFLVDAKGAAIRGNPIEGVPLPEELSARCPPPLPNDICQQVAADAGLDPARNFFGYTLRPPKAEDDDAKTRLVRSNTGHDQEHA